MTLLSGNTLWARTWTDGRQIAPMLPTPPAVVQCAACSECYWLEHAREIGTAGILGWVRRLAIPFVKEPSEDAYHEALERGLAGDADQERSARILAWWRSNDAYRDAAKAGAAPDGPRSGPSRANLKALASLLDESNVQDLIMKAEVMRHLGEFEAAKRMLGRIEAPEYATARSQIEALCDAGDTSLKELSTD